MIPPVAGRSRSVEFDLLVSGTEAGGAKVERLGGKFDELRRKVERLDGTTARVKGIARIEKDSDRLSSTMAKLGGRVFEAGKAVVKFATYAGLAAGAAGPLAIGLATATVAVATFAVETSGAALALLPLAAGALLVSQTLKATGPAMLKAIEPLTEEWQKQTEFVGKLATQGIRPLVAEFAKGNFHVIARAQERIASATNRTLRSVLKWLNTTPAQRTLAEIGDNTAKAYERLLPSVRGVAQSLLMLAGRVAGVSFDTFTSTAIKALDALNGWIDTLGKDDVTRGFDRIRQGAEAVAKGFRAINDAIAFVEENRQKILQLSDAILVLTAVGAAAVGGWIVALGASLLLLARHWGDVTKAARGAGDWFASLPQRFTTLQGVIDAFGVAWASIKTGFREFMADVGPTLTPTLDRLKDSFVKLQPAIAGAVTVIGALIKGFLEFAGPVVGGIIVAVGLVVDAYAEIALAATKAAAVMLASFAAVFQPVATLAKKLKLPFASTFQSFVDGSRNAANRINSSMAQVKTDLARNEIDRLQRRVNSLKGKTVKTEADRREIAASEARIRHLQGVINSVRGKSVSINVTTYYDQVYRASQNSGFGNRATGGGRAVGGPVQAGRSYIVGEHRPEVFVPQQSGRIMPRVPQGWGRGGGGTTTLVLRSDGGRYADFLLSEIRRLAKDTGGGNVQVAFGR